MVDQLLQYIISQEHAGYSEPQIRQALAANGYPQQEIDSAFKQLGPAKLDPDIQSYVQEYAQKGYAPVQIFSTLTQQGYPANKVRKAINEVFGPLMMPQSNTTLVAFALLALVIVSGGIYFLTREQAIIEQPVYVPATQELSAVEQISRIITIAEQQGKEAALKECMAKLFDEERGRCIMAVATYPAINDDKLCDQIVQVNVRDACLVSFLNQKFDSVCSRVQLRDNIELCASVRQYQAPAA